MKTYYFPIKLKCKILTLGSLSIRNAKRSFSSSKKLTPDVNFNLYKGVKRTGNSKYESKYKTLLLPFVNFFKNK